MAHSSKMLQFVSFLLLFFTIPQSSAAPTNSVSTSNAVNPLILTRKHFAELVQYFNTRGWIWDYGGGIAVRVVQPTAIGKELVYVSANKYMKSFYQAEDIFVYDHNEVMQPEYLANKTLPQAISSARDSGDPSVEASSAMNMLRFANYERQKNANFSANEFVALMHTHSKFSNLLSGMSQPGDVIRIQGEQMTNCIEDRSTGQNFAYTDELLIPIIRNDPNEAMFTEPMMELLWKYPKANAIIMHRHGIFVWGQNTWERTKQMLECYEYILEVEYQRRQRIMLENLLAKVDNNGTM